jgi:prevent-host-death family protein
MCSRPATNGRLSPIGDDRADERLRIAAAPRLDTTRLWAATVNCAGEPWHTCYDSPMAQTITQRQLRNDSGDIMRRLSQGEAFVVTRNGVPVGELVPVRRRRLVPHPNVVAAFANAPSIDAKVFREDLDRYVNQDIEPRA